jgi:hypothetical protein
VGHIEFIGKRSRFPRVKGRSPFSAARNNVHRRPYLANLTGSLQSQIFNIRIPSAETWLVCMETGSMVPFLGRSGHSVGPRLDNLRLVENDETANISHRAELRKKRFERTL